MTGLIDVDCPEHLDLVARIAAATGPARPQPTSNASWLTADGRDGGYSSRTDPSMPPDPAGPAARATCQASHTNRNWNGNRP